MDIFVGGGWDDLIPRAAMKQYVRDYTAETGQTTRYFPNARIGQVVGAIREGNAAGGPVNVVGHSWGGPDAYNAVAQATNNGLQVDNLVTLDPVRGLTGPVDGAEHARRWVNVFAAPTHPDFTDRLAKAPILAGKPSTLPVETADQPVNVNLDHADVEGMMRQSGARALLDQSHQSAASPPSPAHSEISAFPPADALHDYLPMMDWIKWREAERAHQR